MGRLEAAFRMASVDLTGAWARAGKRDPHHLRADLVLVVEQLLRDIGAPTHAAQSVVDLMFSKRTANLRDDLKRSLLIVLEPNGDEGDQDSRFARERLTRVSEVLRPLQAHLGGAPTVRPRKGQVYLLPKSARQWWKRRSLGETPSSWNKLLGPGKVNLKSVHWFRWAIHCAIEYAHTPTLHGRHYVVGRAFIVTISHAGAQQPRCSREAPWSRVAHWFGRGSAPAHQQLNR